MATTYEVGQQWSFHCRHEMNGSTLLVAKIDERADGSTIVHVEISVSVEDREKPFVIGHLPFSTKAMDESVEELLASDVAANEGFPDGYAAWKKNNGGVFDLAVADAVDSVMRSLNSKDDDPFDRVVKEMLENQSDATVEALYRMLFRLDKWFFVCDPENESIPVQWVFPEGKNQDPALLAFTTRERAGAAAVSLGVYEDGAPIKVMPVPVREAVAWVGSEDCGNTWICFNLTFAHFPLFCADAARLLPPE